MGGDSRAFEGQAAWVAAVVSQFQCRGEQCSDGATGKPLGERALTAVGRGRTVAGDEESRCHFATQSGAACGRQATSTL